MPPTRTWLTTPPGTSPAVPGRADDAEHYVPGPDLPREPRVPGRHQRLLTGAALVLLLGAIVAGVWLAGQASQAEDPSIPDARQPAGEGDGPPQLPES